MVLNFRIDADPDLVEPDFCPGIKDCLESCPLGHKRDGETGCFTCECSHVGTFESDILVDGNLKTE